MRAQDTQSPGDPELIDTAAAGPAAMRGGMLRTAGYVAGLLLALITAPLIIRHLGNADFGRFAAVLAVITIVTGVLEGGVNTVALRELSATRDEARRNRLMSDLLGLRLSFSLLGVLLAIGFSAVAGYGGDLVLGTLLAGIGMLLAVTQSLIATVLQSRLRFGWITLVDLSRQALGTGMIVLLVLTGAGVVPLLAVSIPAGAAGLLLTIWLVRGTITLRPAFHPRRWMPLLRDTAVFAVAIAVNTLYFRVTLVVMSLVATQVETGEFAISYRVMEVLVGVPPLLIGAAFPIVSRTVHTDRVRFDHAAARLFELATLLGTLGALCLLLGAPFVIEVLTGQRDHPSVEVLQIQSAALIAGFVAAATGFPLLSMKRNRETLIANFGSLVVVLALSLSLAPSFGAVGAAIAAVAADFTLAIVNAAMLRRRGGPPLPLGVLPVAAIAAAAGLVAGSLIGTHPVVEAAVGGTVFLLVVLAAGRFPPEVAELLAHRSSSADTR